MIFTADQPQLQASVLFFSNQGTRDQGPKRTANLIKKMTTLVIYLNESHRLNTAKFINDQHANWMKSIHLKPQFHHRLLSRKVITNPTITKLPRANNTKLGDKQRLTNWFKRGNRLVTANHSLPLYIIKNFVATVYLLFIQTPNQMFNVKIQQLEL